MSMSRSVWRSFLFFLVCCSSAAVIALLVISSNNRKIALVDAVRLFNEYRMKLELEDRAAGSLKYFGMQIDSLKQEIAIQGKNPAVSKQDMEILYRAAGAAQERIEHEYRQSNQRINEEVWERLNPLIDEYGSRQGLRLMIGANGMGSVLYHDDFYDRTNELIDFVNRKYEEGN